MADEEDDQTPPPEEDEEDEGGESAEQRREQAAQTIGKTSSEEQDQPAAATIGKSSPQPTGEPAAQTIAPIGSTEPAETKAASTVSNPEHLPQADSSDPSSASPPGKLHPVTSGVASLWTKADNIHNPVLRVLGKIGAGAARAADTVGSIVAPSAAMMIPGSTLNSKMEENRERRQATEDVENEGRQATTAKTQADTGAVPGEIAERAANTAKITQDTQMAGQPKAKEEEWSIAPGFQGPNGEPLQQEKNSGQLRIAQVPGAQPKPEKQNDFEQFYHDYLTDNKFPDTAHNRLLAREKFAAAGQTPQKPQQQLIVDPSGKVIEVHPGMTLPQGSKTMAGDLAGNKPNAEELKRSEMAENMNENLDKLEEIVKRRPDLFGKIGGRETQMRMLIGSNDPDIGTLKTIHDQMGMAQQSAHSMRSAQHVDAAANSILNSFINGPDAINASIKTARDSLNTFTKDVQQGNPSVRTGASAPVYAANPKTKERVMSTDGGKTWQPAK